MNAAEALLHRARPAWWGRAACRGMMHDPAARADFFPERGRSCGRAREICADCPVRRECLDDALAQGPWVAGIRGGFTEGERRRMIAAAS